MKKPVSLVIYILFLFLILPSCDYNKTSFDLPSIFEPTLDFSKTSQFTFDENFVEVKNGKAQLKALDLEHSESDFNSGTHVGTYFNNSSSDVSLLNFDNSNLLNILPSRAGNIFSYLRLDGGFNAESGFDGTPNNGGSGLTVTDGKINNGIMFDGLDDSISFVAPTFTQLSASAWVKLESYTNSYPRFLELNFNFSVWVQQPPEPPWGDLGSVYIRATHSGTDGYWYSAPGTIELGKLYHITLSYDSSSNTNKPLLVINGQVVQLFERSKPVGTFNNTAGTGYLGNWGLPSSRNWHGVMDEYAIFDVALSESDLIKIYESQEKFQLSDTSLHPSWAPKWDNLVGYWKMDGNWRDSSGNGNHGTVFNGATISFDANVGNSAGLFNELVSHDYIEIPNTTDLENIQAGPFTMQAWYKPLNVPRNIDQSTRAHGIFSKPGWHVGLDYNNDNSFRFNVPNHTPAHQRATSNPVYQTGTYYHIMGVSDGPGGLVKLYVNGKLVSMVPNTGSFPSYGTNNFYIGTGSPTLSPAHSTWAVDGIIDDVALWNTNLKAIDVIKIYNRQKQKYAGHFDSEVIDLGSTTSNWPDLSWSTSLPFGKELVGDYNNDGNTESESSSVYFRLSENLNEGLVGYWPLNEKTLDSVGGADFADFSGNSYACDIIVGGVIASEGKLGSSFSDGQASCGDNLAFSGRSSFSVSVWFKTLLSGSGQFFMIVNKRANPGTGLEGWVCYLAGSSGKASCRRTVGGVENAINSISLLNDGLWHHLAATYDGNVVKNYVDGVLQGTVVDTRDLINAGQDLSYGDNQADAGSVDEVAIWERALSADEVQQIYRRGANRIKLQVKSCVDSNCECKSFSSSPQGSAADCDGDTIVNALDFDDPHKADFIGPGGDGATYYSEAFNRKGTDTLFNCGNNTSDSDGNICVNDEISLIGSPKPEGPSIDFTDFPLSAKPLDNQYIQYRVYMEADDNTACQGSPCLPELSSVNLNPSGATKYYGSVQEIKSIQPIIYKDIQSVKVIADDCVTYQLSPDGTNYYHWISNAWAPVTSHIDSSNQSDFANYISNYSSQFGSGQLFIKALLQTNSQQSSNCSIKSIDFNYSK